MSSRTLPSRSVNGRKSNSPGVLSQILLHLGPELAVAEGQHAAVGMMHHRHLAGAQEALRNDEGAERVAGPAAAFRITCASPSCRPKAREAGSGRPCR
jgi:hypothetical protein